ncbi:hypothetical protein H5410_033395 [Solanum commersonii]|uniref:Uncharacterized protein n=1 Tax=Solanum commersonii TaxID=4109 RepID=A0A9J5YNL2_SOLCO|nr:hypothetical protein H5410_033395 [Solanum commersonii]
MSSVRYRSKYGLQSLPHQQISSMTKFFPSFKLPCDFPSFDGAAFVWRSMGNAESLYNSNAGPALNGWPAAIILSEIRVRV